MTHRRRVAALLVPALVLTAACSSSEGGDRSDRPASTAPSARRSSGGHACDQGATQAVEATVPRDEPGVGRTITSFDGTKIRAHWFPAPKATASRPAPTILMGPGWSLPGDTLEAGITLFGALDIREMNRRGYNVLTWDPRGFGRSTGTVEVDHVGHEGRDVRVLLDWVATQPRAELDGPGDPRVGMVGFSYGGGIQLVVAASDCRVDAIVPGLAWHSLRTSLFKAETVKAGWSEILSSIAGPGSHLDPHITSAADSGLSTGTLSDEDRDWFLSRGPGKLVDRITAPTLFVQGTTDTLFTLDEATTNLRSLRRRGVPTAMIWFCGGHGTCLSAGGTTARVTSETYAWLSRYLEGDRGAPKVPTLATVDQHDDWWTADRYPLPTRDLTATGSPGSLALTKASVAGPVVPEQGGDVLLGLVAPITPAKADVAAELAVAPKGDGLLLGAPKLTLTYAGTTPAATGDEAKRPTRVFAQLVDDSSGLVVGNQITPIAVTLDGEEHRVAVDLEVIAHRIAAPDRLTLQLVATTPAYATPRLGGKITFRRAVLTLPLAKGVTPPSGR